MIRGQKVMLDADLAEIYGYETKNFNRQVKNNSAKFDGEDFMFRLTELEAQELSRCKKFTLNNPGGRGSNIKYKPYAFTEQGIYMLMTVLKGDLAIKQSRAPVRLFKSMKDYLTENQDLIGQKELLRLSVQTSDNTKDIAQIKDTMATKEDLKKIMDNFIDPGMYRHFLILDGQKIEADAAYINIYKSARKTIFIVDNYVGFKTPELLSQAAAEASVTILSDNIAKPCLTETVINDYIKEHPGAALKLKPTGHKLHDRYIVIDYNTDNEKIYLCGASSKDAGRLITTIIRVEDTSPYHLMLDRLL